MSNSQLQVAAIGVGHLGRHHARIYAEHPGCTLVGVVDTNSEQAQSIAQKFTTQAYYDYRELPPDVAAVSIATPTQTHFQIARHFLEKGSHVLLEKPMSKTVEEAEILVNLAQQKELVFQIGHLERFNAAFIEAKTYVSQPGFIETQRIGSFSPRSLDVDVILDLMIHDIDIVLSLVKSPIRSISAVGVPVLTEKIDIANARLIFESGCVANMTASRASLDQTRKIRIFQKDLYLSLDYALQKLFLCKKLPPSPANSQAFPRIDKQDMAITPVEPLKAEIQSFLDCVKHQKTPVVSGEDGLSALQVAFKILNEIES